MLTAKVVKGSVLLSAGQLAIRFIDVALIVVTARILLPEDFGLVAIANTTLIIIGSVTNFPVLDALIRKEKILPREVDTAFTLNFARCALVAIVIVGTSHLIADLYEDNRLIDVLYVLALSVLAQGLISPGMALFARELNFKPQVMLFLASKVLAVTITIVLAVVTRSYWAIIIGLTATPVLQTIGSHIFRPYLPRLSLFNYKGFVHFTGWITASNSLSTANAYGDRLFIGAIVGPNLLGHYYQAGVIAITATANFISPFSQVLFSAFSKLQDDHVRLGKAFLRSQYAIAVVMFPLGAFLSVMSSELVLLALGPNWNIAGDFLVWLFPSEALLALLVPIHSVILACGLTHYLAVRELIFLFLRLLPVVLITMYLGLYEAIVVRALLAPMLLLTSFYFVKKAIRLSVRAQMLVLLRPAVAACFAMAILYWFKQFVTAPADVLTLAGYIAAGFMMAGAAYVLALFALWFAAGRPPGPEKEAISRSLKIISP